MHFAGFTASYSFVFPFPERMWPFQYCFVPDCLFTVAQYFKQSLSHWLTHLYHKYQLLLWKVTVPWREWQCGLKIVTSTIQICRTERITPASVFWGL